VSEEVNERKNEWQTVVEEGRRSEERRGKRAGHFILPAG